MAEPAAEDPVAANRRLWDARTPLHVASAYYDVDSFLAGRTALHGLELAEIGDDVRRPPGAGAGAGARLLHLQCHFGLDTLSWARDGGAGSVVGVDFSPVAVAAASDLAARAGLAGRAQFVEADVRSVDAGAGSFDVVYVSYGALCWLPELESWASVVARHLRPGGFAYVAEIHPAAATLNDEPGVAELVVGYPYWTASEDPLRFEESGTYADVDAPLRLPEYVWNHGLGDVVNALVGAGLVVEWLREYPFTVYPQFPFLVEDPAERLWRLPEGMPPFPLLFTLRARRRRP